MYPTCPHCAELPPGEDVHEARLLVHVDGDLAYIVQPDGSVWRRFPYIYGDSHPLYLRLAPPPDVGAV